MRSRHLDHTSCLISDLQIPGPNGVKLQKLLLSQGRNIPVISVTAFREGCLRARAVEAGALGFLSKPFESEIRIRLIHKPIGIGRKACTCTQ